MTRDRNVFGEPLTPCCHSPKTGFYRDGFCRLDTSDVGVHCVCAVVTDEFLAFSEANGNDLVTPRPEFGFPGLKSGDRWCLCAQRWQQAADAGLAPPVILSATNARTLDIIPLATLQQYAMDAVH